jgi:GT2 family glycosyltransferase
MSLTPRVYVLAPVHNRREVTEKFIHRLLEQTYSNWHLVLIDDGSRDGTEAMARALVPSLTVLHGEGNWWWAGSLQQGHDWLKQNARPDDVVLIANDDTEFDPEFLGNAVKALKPRSLMLSQLYDLKGNFLETGVHWNWRRMRWSGVQNEISLNCFSTRGLFLHVGAFMEIGGFHPLLLPHYLSDYEFTMRAHRKGFALTTAPGVYLRFYEHLTGVREIRDRSLLKTLRGAFSIRSTDNPIYWTSFVLLASPLKYMPANLIRVWWRYFVNAVVQVQVAREGTAN